MHLIVTKRWMKVGTKMFFKITKILIVRKEGKGREGREGSKKVG